MPVIKWLMSVFLMKTKQKVTETLDTVKILVFITD